MCFAASAVYLLNDLCDLKEDQQHPVKKDRPLAAGRLSPKAAKAGSVSLAVASIVVAIAAATPGAAVIIAIYIALSVLYSTVLKHIVILDVMFIAVGFVLRILAGAFAVSVTPSHWLFLCTINVALFLGFGKRRAELIALDHNTAGHRNVLQHYSLTFIDQMISVVTSATLVCYILYTVDQRTVQVFGTRMLVLTVPFVAYGLFRYLYLLYHQREGDSPTRTLLLDGPFLINAALWGLSCIAIIYGNFHVPNWFEFG